MYQDVRGLIFPELDQDELFEFIKEIKDKENGNITDDAIKLIVKISEGSVRDALSLLDRALLSLENGNVLDLVLHKKYLDILIKHN